jgi:hypothetical protein
MNPSAVETLAEKGYDSTGHVIPFIVLTLFAKSEWTLLNGRMIQKLRRIT